MNPHDNHAMPSFPDFRFPVVLAAALVLAGCVAPAPAPQVPVDTTTPAQRMAAIETAAGVDDTELTIQPLRDPEVDDLRELARQQREAGNLPAAGDALDQALLLVDNDPGILQERAEIAVLQGDWPRAGTLARKALELGSKTGPLCRRHWATVEQSHLARGEAENAASAKAQIASCTVPGVQRF